MVLSTTQDSNKQYSSKFIRQSYEFIEYLDRINELRTKINELRTKQSPLQMRKEKEPPKKDSNKQYSSKFIRQNYEFLEYLDRIDEGRGSNKTV